MTEKIDCAAIRHADGTVFTVPRPGRHHDVIAAMTQARKPYNGPGIGQHVQGFVTDTGRFVDRYEARRIAEEASQLLDRESGLPQLYSEDVW
jgi:hypothetical protein